MIQEKERNLDVVGKSYTRVDGYEKVTGRAVFVGDMRLPGQLYGKILHSTIAHGIVKRINTEKAKELPGVAAVVTYEDVPQIPFTVCGHPLPFDTPKDCLILTGHVRYVGDPIAAVAAETPEIARKAVELIEVEYEKLPSYLTIDAAIGEDALEIHEGLHNIAGEHSYEIGCVDEAFANAAYVFEDVIETPIVTHCQIEPHVSLVDMEPDTGRLIVYVSNQVPNIMRERISYALGLKIRDVKVIKKHVGGGFGGKQEPVFEIINCVLAMKAKRPVLLEATREECIAMTRTRHASRVIFRSALDKEFRFIGRDITIYNNTGAYSSHGHNVMFNISTQCAMLYPTPNLRFHGITVYTNLLIAGAMRGYGIPQWASAMEAHVDNIAARLHLDPLEFRNINIFHMGDPINVENMHINSCGIPQILEEGTKAIGWAEFQPEERCHGKIKRGIGMSCCSYGLSCYPHSVELSSARVMVNEDGSATLFFGCTEIGQGSDTVMKQIAAEALGIPFEWIRIGPMDTDISPFDVGAYASRQTSISGMAVKKAAAACKQDILDFAAKMLPMDRERLDIREGYLVDTVGQRRVCPLEKVTMKMIYSFPEAQTIVHEAYHYPTDNGCTFAGTFAIVWVDEGTGKVEIEKLVTVMDCGKLMNPMLAMGQLTGGSIMCLGFGTMEQILINPETGAVYNDNMLDYKIPTMSDIPPMEAIFVETDEPSSAYGNKGLGEPPNISPAAAIRNAVANAVKVPMNQYPLTPERVSKTIKEYRRKECEA